MSEQYQQNNGIQFPGGPDVLTMITANDYMSLQTLMFIGGIPDTKFAEVRSAWEREKLRSAGTPLVEIIPTGEVCRVEVTDRDITTTGRTRDHRVDMLSVQKEKFVKVSYEDAKLGQSFGPAIVTYNADGTPVNGAATHYALSGTVVSSERHAAGRTDIPNPHALANALINHANGGQPFNVNLLPSGPVNVNAEAIKKQLEIAKTEIQKKHDIMMQDIAKSNLNMQEYIKQQQILNDMYTKQEADRQQQIRELEAIRQRQQHEAIRLQQLRAASVNPGPSLLDNIALIGIGVIALPHFAPLSLLIAVDQISKLSNAIDKITSENGMSPNDPLKLNFNKDKKDCPWSALEELSTKINSADVSAHLANKQKMDEEATHVYGYGR